ncbi:NADP-dependent oxidoreductase [Deinococcus sp.]|uniref:NADP-dependent oxidoreductase n=1 Tax=Deinococcus sp. TaxID=47478 RepID=UPI003B5B2934
MRAARFHSFGASTVLQVEEVPWPAPQRDEVLIRVHASSINGTDLQFRGGQLGPLLASQLPFTPGFDVAGEVVGGGPSVTAFAPGERVYALLGHRGGGAAEYVAVRQSRIGPAPHSVSLVEAAAVPLSGLTALQALRGEGHLKAGQRVLIYGASGGIGAFAVQLAKILGAHVTGVARAEKLEFVRQLGADVVLATGEVSWDAAPPYAQPYDLIFDTPAALHFDEVRQALSGQGVLVSSRGLPTSPGDVAALLRRRGPRFANVRTAERGLDLAYLSRLIEAGQLKIPVDRIFPISDIRGAHTYAEGPEVRGKVVVSLEASSGGR